CQRHYGIPLTF
nr:immunoglobulin light chain junction region [Mus musculus]NSL97957.1 immunoglobulin light chain junction region [Mus musculus]NSL98289.1 immunoglobulin light chain junction region [Mus musculus]NSL98519.1 immunoglobulin light chain junction region [Mus musculus]NSL98926.1 immunoglobulin light chain junction region [Mus musculus]